MDEALSQESGPSAPPKRPASGSACLPCRIRKIKCEPGADSEECKPCNKAGIQCSTLPPPQPKDKDSKRASISQLRERIATAREGIQKFLDLVPGNVNLVNPHDHPHSPDDLVQDKQRPADPLPSLYVPNPTLQVDSSRDNIGLPVQRSPTHPSNYIGQGSGLGPLWPLLNFLDSRTLEARILDALSKSQDPSSAASKVAQDSRGSHCSARLSYCEAPAFPTEALCRMFTESYLSDTHLLHPIIAQHEVYSLRDRVLPFIFEDVVKLARLRTNEAIAPNGAHASRHDFFQAFLIFAIGCATAGNRPLSYPRSQDSSLMVHDPKAAVLSLYRSAMLFCDNMIVAPGLDACRNLLLLARLSTLCRTGLSVWETSRICLAMCVAEEMHLPVRASRRNSISAFAEQMRRRVFWDCYKLDRYSSSTLGRPVGIADAEIGVQLPCDLDDNFILGLEALPDDVQLQSPSTGTSEMSVFIHSVRMRQITSELNRSLNQDQVFATAVGLSSTKTTTRDAYRLLKETLDRLDDWERKSPIYTSYMSLFQLPSYMKILGQKERLWIGKLLIDRMPTRDGCPPLDILNICQEAATNVILEYDEGRQSPHLMYYLRADLHLIFQAGVSLLLSIAVKNRLLQSIPLDGTGHLPVHQQDLLQGNNSITSAEEALHRCYDLLQEITEVLEEATFLRDIFHIFHRHAHSTNEDIQQGATMLDASLPKSFESSGLPTDTRLNHKSPNGPNVIDPQAKENMSPVATNPPPSLNWNPLNNIPSVQVSNAESAEEMQWMTEEVWSALQDEMTQYFGDPFAEFGNWPFY